MLARVSSPLFALLLCPGLVLGAETDFAACVEGLKTRALEQGISRAVVERDLAAVKKLERVLELDRRQPEFVESFATYFERRVTEDRIRKGRQLLTQHGPLLQRIQREYGVPAQYLVAFWGLETNFGSFFGRMPVLDALATLACDARRSDYFAGELVNALRIVDEGAISAERMQGSWAGAMGHTQFMPSVFLRYAVDYDGDGRRDLWSSIPDALASAANFLRGIGWQPEQRWGREVHLPEGFDYSLAGLQHSRPLSQWQALGVRTVWNQPLPNVDLEASLLIPTGHQGPAFLVYPNFHVIMRWNRAEAYALAVGHLADQINGGAPLTRPPVAAPRLTREQIRTLQHKLNDAGHEAGDPDGVLGPGTRAAISRYQREHGLVADGFADTALLVRMGITPESP